MRDQHMFFHPRQFGLMAWTRLSVLLVAVMMLASACSPPPSSSVSGPPGAGAAKSTADPTAAKRPPGLPGPSPMMGPPSVVSNKPAEKNSLIALASEILTAGTNPFLSKLPKPKVEISPEAVPGETVEAPPMADAFANFQLLGVVFKDSKSMALLSLGAETGTEMVRVGDMFFANGSQISVKSIGRDEVALEKLGPAPEVKILPLPSIVGYGATSSSNAPAVDSAEGAAVAGTPSHAGGGRLKLEEL